MDKKKKLKLARVKIRKPWSINIPIKHFTRWEFYRNAMIYKLEPNELIICFDHREMTGLYEKDKAIHQYYFLPFKPYVAGIIPENAPFWKSASLGYYSLINDSMLNFEVI